MVYIICGILLFSLIIYLAVYKDIKFLDKGEKFDFKVYRSPQNQHTLTLMLHTDGAGFNYYSYIYLIPGRYKLEKLPKEENYIKFSDGTGVIIRWEKDNLVEVLCDSSPIVNKFKSKGYDIKITVNRNYFDTLVEEGKKDAFIRYKIN
jgi:hypothetical protein